ncbi:Membrane proteinase PrsW, cleaves anti-sigma factor RsiW, M82 family [Sulfobacillus thermosulfidooxidans DSM 9293]|uniref:Membrane proteinase PrsW, cleaves anti-sigma factor RsiW, M82 family n=2 Tax=Sulfobacillus thermosulfidooxidans TaxID=28034 RepID=A0A1W1WJJ9_SULTA|nr:PrsW family glutamic-type intramembrane protease [Sulfobacillus thermosulfidooxidans]PSR27497.1 MAG: PrsW family intramembrane metalloprotease [Sulfobacillus thermosulfidooxidans]SMC06372.1 Membrane proteinase PrsW, cleaves anti-sigma factor RsiW, M82 family [Sulfobacillus thermosulfidooxidans DSM 9293]
MNLPPHRHQCENCGAPIDELLCDACRNRQAGLFAVAYRPLPNNFLLYIFTILKSRLFLGLFVFATAPILLGDLHLNIVDGMMVYFSLFWFFIFQPLMAAQLRIRSLLLDITAYVFTGTLGVFFALTVESFWINHGANLLLNSHVLFISAPAYVLFIGLTEEFAKQMIVLLIFFFNRAKKKAWSPLAYMMVGISSGLGFSAVENISYVQHGILFDVLHHSVGLGTITALTRALYTPFLHAIWAGIVAYALGIVAQRGYRDWHLAVGAYLIAAIFHGFYDASLGYGDLSILDVALSYLVFLSLLLNNRRRQYLGVSKG